MSHPGAPADFSRVGLVVGHATDESGATGLTVLRAPAGGLRAGVAVVGRATGTRELHAATPDHLVERIDAVLLTGGSAYGLDAAAGVMRWMEERGRGVSVPGGVVPIVPAAVIFDLAPLGRGDARPTADMAWRACDDATSTGIAEGSVGAGTGATVGKMAGPQGAMKGGFGCALHQRGDLAVGAFAVVNALGDVCDASGAMIAGARDSSGSFVRPFGGGAGAMQNTTLCAVATNASLDRVQLSQLARAASAALFRRIMPTGTTFDGDVVFALGPDAGGIVPGNVVEVEMLAVAALEEAIERAVRLARGRDGIPGLGDAP